MLVSPGSRDPDAVLSPSETLSPSADAAEAQETPGGDSKQVEECEPSAGCGEKAPPSESSSEENISCDSESLDLQLSAVADSSLRIDESDDSPEEPSSPKENGLENGKVSGMEGLSAPHKVGVLRSSQLVTTSSVFHSASLSPPGRCCRKPELSGHKEHGGLKRKVCVFPCPSLVFSSACLKVSCVSHQQRS